MKKGSPFTSAGLLIQAKHHVKRPPPVCLVSECLLLISVKHAVDFCTGFAFLGALVEPPRQACGVSPKRYLPMESAHVLQSTAAFIFN
jgi:hypothetical protein